MGEYLLHWPDNKETQGREIALKQEFFWGGRRWLLPSLYLFEQGVILDVLLEASAEELSAFIEKWDLLHEQEHDFSELEREQIEQEHPLICSFHASLHLDGQSLKQKGMTMRSWIPAVCLGGKAMEDRSMKAAMAHYSLDEERGWALYRCRFPFGKETQRDFQQMELELRQDPRTVFGPLLSAPREGTVLDFHDPDGQEHRLTVHEIALEQLRDEQRVLGSYQVLTYSVEPDMLLTLRDTKPSDCGCAPLYLLSKDRGRKTAFSSVRRDAQTATDWQLLFSVQAAEDLRLRWENEE